MQGLRALMLIWLFVGITFAEHYTPLFLWGAYSENRPALGITTADEFVQLAEDHLSTKALVMFVEPNLTTKDFLRTNEGRSSYPNLQAVEDKTYFAAVQNPVEALLKDRKKYEYVSVDSSGKLPKFLETTPGKIYVVKFNGNQDEVSKSRASILQSHDSIMKSIASDQHDVIFVYTSLSPPSMLKRQRRQSSEQSQEYVIRDGKNLLFYFKDLSIIEDKKVTPFDMDVAKCAPPNSCVNKINNTIMSVTLTSKNGSPLTFDITFDADYFFMKNVKYNSYTFLSSEVYAPSTFSYFCGNLTLNNMRSDLEKVPAVSLKWNYLQFQAPFGQTKDENFVFGDPWHCVGFFTGGILSGLLVAVLLLTITFIGICWMMDINTMDRFDDPKGKTITVNASD